MDGPLPLLVCNALYDESVTVELVFVLMSFAAFRVSRFVALDTFPPMEWLRWRVVNRWAGPVTTSATEEPKGWIHRHSTWVDGIECPHCVGVYASILVVLITSAFVSVPLPLLQVAAVAGFQSFLASYASGMDN